MNYFSTQALLVAGVDSEESTFLVQILVFLLFAVLWGVYSLVKDKRTDFQSGEEKHIKKSVSSRIISLLRFKLSPKPSFDFVSSASVGRKKPAGGKKRDVNSGMELLGIEFLLNIVEDTEGNDDKDVTMRKHNFGELIRRRGLGRVNSKALKIYAIDCDGLYGKNIQCEAIRELSERTSRKSCSSQTAATSNL